MLGLIYQILCHVPRQVRITASNPLKTYISYALALLNEKGHSTIVLRSMGRAINKTVAIGELRPSDQIWPSPTHYSA